MYILTTCILKLVTEMNQLVGKRIQIFFKNNGLGHWYKKNWEVTIEKWILAKVECLKKIELERNHLSRTKSQ